MSPGRWSDDAIDELAYSVRALRDIPKEVAVVSVRVDNIEADIAQLASASGQVIEKLDSYIGEQRALEEDRRKERKTDRRWQVGTVLTATGIVIAALALLADKL